MLRVSEAPPGVPFQVHSPSSLPTAWGFCSGSSRSGLNHSQVLWPGPKHQGGWEQHPASPGGGEAPSGRHTSQRCLSPPTERISQTVEILKHTVDIEEKGVKLKLTIVDTPGFGDAVNNSEW